MKKILFGFFEWFCFVMIFHEIFILLHIFHGIMKNVIKIDRKIQVNSKLAFFVIFLRQNALVILIIEQTFCVYKNCEKFTKNPGEIRNLKIAWKMAYQGSQKVQKVMVQPINLIFRFLQNRTRVQVWLYENVNTRIEGKFFVKNNS